MQRFEHWRRDIHIGWRCSISGSIVGAGAEVKFGEGMPPECRFIWDQKKAQCAVALATGKTQKQVAKEVGVPERTQRSWLSHPDFAAEVDRLSLMVDIASRAERLRIAMRVVRESVKDEVVRTEKDVLDWLKFAQSETDGIKLDLTKLAAVFKADSPMADSGSDRQSANQNTAIDGGPASEHTEPFG